MQNLQNFKATGAQPDVGELKNGFEGFAFLTIFLTNKSEFDLKSFNPQPKQFSFRAPHVGHQRGSLCAEKKRQGSKGKVERSAHVFFCLSLAFRPHNWVALLACRSL